ncbi:hypothetical protein [Amycolatopsis pigmentata]|uniref:MarR family transcriptional regulator n=1 Tax=Amycolatopsis pigmentata TaxID=450801 RepID=A0ABW5G0N0_9PSEU
MAGVLRAPDEASGFECADGVRDVPGVHLMSAERALPTVIGPTENALRALLAKTLSTTAIADYEAWVTLNIVSRAAGDGADAGSRRSAVADGLRQPVTAGNDVIARLRTTKLLDEDGTLTDRGAAELAAARVAVRDVTSALVAGISDVDQETTRQVLDRIRHNAENHLRG